MENNKFWNILSWGLTILVVIIMLVAGFVAKPEPKTAPEDAEVQAPAAQPAETTPSAPTNNNQYNL